MITYEVRDNEAELTVTDGKLSGYAVVWDKETTVWVGAKSYQEVVRKGCFSEYIASGEDTICTIDHDEHYMLGRRSSGTLQLKEDDYGVWFEVQLDLNIDYHNNLAILHGRKDIVGCSFTFFPKPGGMRRVNGVVELVNCELIELGPVVRPVYKGTSLAMRSNKKIYKYKCLLREKYL